MNRLNFLFLVLISVAAFGFGDSSVLYAQQSDRIRVIEGQAVNRTTMGSDVSGLTVTLHVESSAKHEHFTAITDLQGSFRFDDVVFEEETTYGVSVVYQGALYGSDIDLSKKLFHFVNLVLYDSNSSQDSLSISSVSVLFSQVNQSSQLLWVMEIVKVNNITEKTYVPGPEPMKLLRFSLPPGAQDLVVDTDLAGADVLQVDLGFALTASVPPGEHEVMFAYQFPYSDVEETFTKSLPFGADNMRVLAPREMVFVSSESLSGPKSVDIGGSSYQLLTATDLPRDSSVSLNLVGLPMATFGEQIDRKLQYIRWELGIVLVLGLIMVGTVSFVMFRRDRLGSGRYRLENNEQQRRRIVDMITELDEFSKDELSDDLRYRKRLRSALIDKLKCVSKGRDSTN